MIEQRLATVRAAIEAACAKAGRDPGSVRLLPVTKTRPVDDIIRTQELGIDVVGENKVQELVAKSEALADAGISFALIGPLQSNKVNKVIQHASEFQALSTLKIAAALDKRLQAANRSLDVMVQVNSSGEASKFGLDPSETVDFCQQLDAFDSLNVTGLMTIAANTDDHTKIAQCFSTMRDLQKRLRDVGAANSAWNELSMGMSADYELAIEYGATCVRIGSAIYGTREKLEDWWPGVPARH